MATGFSRRAFLAAAPAALLAGCGSGGGGSSRPGPSVDGGTIIPPPPEVGSEAILKISYFRSYPEPRTRKLEAWYRVVMSNSWKDKVGDGPKEPFPKAAPGKIYIGFVTDNDMIRWHRDLKSFGVDQLVATAPESYRPEDIHQAALGKDSSFMRIFTLGSNTWHKSYCYRDQHKSGQEALIPIFTKCEAYVSRVCEYSISVRTTTDPLAPR